MRIVYEQPLRRYELYRTSHGKWYVVWGETGITEEGANGPYESREEAKRAYPSAVGQEAT